MPILAALAELRQNDIVDDAIIEIVAGNADAAMTERLRARHISRNVKTNDRIVRRAAAEIGDQHGCRLRQSAGEEEGGGHRLVDIKDFGKAETAQRRVVAFLRQRRVGLRASKFHRAADNQTRRQFIELSELS